ncbi:hypothetical protein KIN20_024186 [Parelaphostrongylus tenuis]|uniref:Uncharacterized protein n=1 Tax=Parelaphostrongylus tenuis TaxID=148309 RepID=A0AAD5MWP6_PARTN|nr:hypothetical protein KIN20_024186 [Parelaphostrongylus tenuis]
MQNASTNSCDAGVCLGFHPWLRRSFWNPLGRGAEVPFSFCDDSSNCITMVEDLKIVNTRFAEGQITPQKRTPHIGSFYNYDKSYSESNEQIMEDLKNVIRKEQ